MERKPFAGSRRLLAIGLFVFVAAIYLLATSGRDYGADGAQTYLTLENAFRGRLNIDERGADIGAKLSPDGHYYSKYGPTQSIVEVPAFVALRVLYGSIKVPATDRLALLRAWTPILTNALIAAATVIAVWLLTLQIGYRAVTALWMALIVAFTTPLFFYARVDLSEPLQSLLVVAIFLALVRARQPADALAVGILLGLLFLTKAIFVVLVPVVWAALLWRMRPRNLRTIASITAAFGVPVALCGLAYLGWNYLRFQSAFDFGYNETFDNPVLLGLFGLFFSSGKSVFLYAPVLVVALFAAPRFARQRPFEAVLILGMSLPFCFLYAAFWAWHGDWSWGPRYMVPFMALWILPVAAFLESGMVRRGIVAVAALAGLFVQILGVAINPGTYLSVQSTQVAPKVHDGQKLMIEQAQIDVHFIPEFSPIAGHFWLMKAAIARLREPGKSFDQYPALHNYPWLRFGHEHWKPDHPEYGAVLDLWMVEPPPYMGRRALLPLTVLLAALALTGLVLIARGLRGSAADDPPHAVSG
jgi:hypothetical protein